MIKKSLTFLLVLSLLIPAAPVAQSDIPETMPLSQIAIPESLGKIQDRFQGTSKRWVVQIQDVHGHVAAQENISAILDHLQVVYGIKTVAVEGGWQASSLPKSWGLPNSREKQLLARALLDDGYLSGPGYAAIFSSMPLMLVGVESRDLYFKNREVFLKYLNDPKSVDEKIKVLVASIQEEKNSTFNPELLSFDKSLVSFRDGHKIETFLPSLMELAASRKVDLLKMNQVANFAKILDISNSISQEKLKSESARLTSSFKAKRLSFEELLRSGKVPEADLEYYPEMQKYIQVMKLQDKIDHVAFFDEVDEVIKLVKEKLFTSDVEKTLDQKSERFIVAKKILSYQATPKEVSTFYQDQDAIETIVKEGGLSEAFELSKQFYEYAQKRDEIFFQKLTKDERLSADVAIVTGGFHTDGLSTQLRAAGVSYVVITPDLASQMPNDKMYHKLLKINSPEAPKNTLSAERWETSRLDDIFPEGVRRSRKGGGFDVQAGLIFVVNDLMGPQTQASATGQATESENFLSLPEAKQKALLEAAFKSSFNRTGKRTFPRTEVSLVIVTGEALQRLIQTNDPESGVSGLAALTATVQNPNLRMIIPVKEVSNIPDAVVGSRRVTTLPGKEIEAVLRDPKLIGRYIKRPDQQLAIISGESLTEKTAALLLPEDPFSLLIFGLALSNPSIRNAVSTPAGFKLAKSLLLSIESVQAYLKSA